MKSFDTTPENVRTVLQQNTVESWKSGLYDLYRQALAKQALMEIRASDVKGSSVWPNVYDESGYVSFSTQAADEAGSGTIVTMQKTAGRTSEVLPYTNVRIGTIENGSVLRPNEIFKPADLALAAELARQQQAVATAAEQGNSPVSVLQ